ncbi:MAG: hypothetical protein IJ672_00290 [Methanobrevibacter sp.]|nr:hypothetical protein [Methanobrevibacter sp.]
MSALLKQFAERKITTNGCKSKSAIDESDLSEVVADLIFNVVKNIQVMVGY